MVSDRLDFSQPQLRDRLLKQCRLKPGDIWPDKISGHVVACGDATHASFVNSLFETERATLAVHDPPYNQIVFGKQDSHQFVNWCSQWVDITANVLTDDAALYIWMGADQKEHFQPLPQFMAMMAETSFDSRSLITMRNQRGYGTQKNWMAVRQELLYYTKGNPPFEVQYTDIPKILRGYYKDIDGRRTENLERGRSDNIRPGNVWVDIQQVFYRMAENVNGCYAQKPLKAIERIIKASSREGETVTDFFAHSGTTLIAAELHRRRCVTFDIDPIFAEITIRRLEHYRRTGRTGWQMADVFPSIAAQTNRPTDHIVVAR
jgi:site-specific DNA-methyltransferase (adenine-specific)